MHTIVLLCHQDNRGGLQRTLEHYSTNVTMHLYTLTAECGREQRQKHRAFVNEGFATLLWGKELTGEPRVTIQVPQM